MNFQNDRYTLRLALPEDDAGIAAIFAAGHFDGGIAVQFLRPSPLASFAADGDGTRILVIRDNAQSRIAAVGGAVLRTEFLRGVPQKTAYLTGLKVHPDYQKQLLFIPRAYQFLGEQLAGCVCCYTTILDGNTPVIRMLEKKHRNMPEYRYIGHYTTYCFHGGRKLLSLEQTDISPVRVPALDLTPAKTDYPGFGTGHYYLYRDGGSVLASCFLGDQTAFKQYRMAGYGGIYRLVSKLPTRLLGYPAFPRAGEIIRHGIISQLFVRNDDPAVCKAFLRSVAAVSDCSMLLWGGFENHPLCPALERMKTVHYGSRLYEVIWEGVPQLSNQIGMEAALL